MSPPTLVLAQGSDGKPHPILADQAAHTATSEKQDTANSTLTSILGRIGSTVLADILTAVSRIPALGSALKAASLPVTIATDDTARTDLDNIATATGRIPAQGSAAMAGALPVTLATDGPGVANLAAIAASAVLLQHPTRTAAITKSDSTDITSTATKGLWIGTGGDVAVKGAGDSSAVTLKNVPSGTYLPGAYKAVMSTNTTAADIVSFYGP